MKRIDFWRGIRVSCLCCLTLILATGCDQSGNETVQPDDADGTAGKISSTAPADVNPANDEAPSNDEPPSNAIEASDSVLTKLQGTWKPAASDNPISSQITSIWVISGNKMESKIGTKTIATATFEIDETGDPMVLKTVGQRLVGRNAGETQETDIPFRVTVDTLTFVGPDGQTGMVYDRVR